MVEPSARPVALVSGSSSGIGAAIARAFAGRGVEVVINSVRSTAAGEQLAAELGGTYVQADIGDPEAARGLVASAIERYGRLDYLVNNAATTEVIPLADLEAATTEIWQRILGVNVIGTWSVSVAAMPHLRAGDGGAIVNISSSSANRPTGSSIPYTVSKAGVEQMTRMLAKVGGPEVRVNALAPGLTDTPWTADWHEARENVRANIPLHRSGQPEELAQACLAIAENPYMTGTVVTVDGGLSLT
jgi:ketoreductase RED2